MSKTIGWHSTGKPVSARNAGTAAVDGDLIAVGDGVVAGRGDASTIRAEVALTIFGEGAVHAIGAGVAGSTTIDIGLVPILSFLLQTCGLG